MQRQIPPGRSFSCPAPTLAPNLAALGLTCNLRRKDGWRVPHPCPCALCRDRVGFLTFQTRSSAPRGTRHPPNSGSQESLHSVTRSLPSPCEHLPCHM